MPRYFFHIYDGDTEILDSEGTICENTVEARAQAVTSAGSMLKELDTSDGSRMEWRMTVIDEAGDTVCLLRFTAECST